MVDENQIGPNMHTTPVQRYVRDGPYPSGKAVPCNLKVVVSNPSGVNLQYVAGPRIPWEIFFCFFFVLTLFSLLGTPENARFLPTCWPPRRQGLGIQF